MMFKNLYFLEVIKNLIFKILNIFLGMLIIPLSISKLGKNDYGLWITIMSIVTWFNISDFGLGNFIRNEVSYNIKKNKEKLQKSVSEVFTVLIFIVIILSIGISFLYSIGILNKLLKNIFIDKRIIILFVYIYLNFIVNFIFGLYISISYGISKSYNAEISNTIFSITVLFFIYIIENISLINFALIYLIASIISKLFLFLIVIKEDKIFLPKFLNIKRIKIKKIICNGGSFFILQVCGIILFSTDNIIISKFLNNSLVTEFSLINKIYETGVMIYSLIMIPLWGRVASAFANDDFNWIEQVKKYLLKVAGIFFLGTVFVSLLINNIINFWIKTGDYNFDKKTILIFLLYNCIVYINAIYVNILNGLGIIKLQSFVAVITAILNIPLSIFFMKEYNLEIGGVKLATLFCVLISMIVSMIQVKKVLKTKK